MQLSKNFRRHSRRLSAHDLTHIHSALIYGGGERDRTDDLLVANQALSHLSYTPDSHP